MKTTATVLASDFASLADLKAYQDAKRRGLPDRLAFKVGDNGIGCWGDLTAQTHTPMCALPPETMIAWWGSIAKAKHQKVKVVDVETQKFTICVLSDRMPEVAHITNGCGIDLNPAALMPKELDLKSPITRKVTISKV
jgi:hypothetical protein